MLARSRIRSVPAIRSTITAGRGSVSQPRASGAVTGYLPAMRARLGRSSPTPESVPPTAFAVRARPPAPPGRFDQLGHRAVQDVQQRHQDLQAQPFGPVDDQPVDLARGQPDPRAANSAISRWWRTCPDRPSPLADASGSRVCAASDPPFRFLPGAMTACRANPLAQRGVHEVAADVGINRGRRVTAAPPAPARICGQYRPRSDG